MPLLWHLLAQLSIKKPCTGQGLFKSLIYKYFLYGIGARGIAAYFALEIIVAKHAWLTLMTNATQIAALVCTVQHFLEFIKVVGPEFCLGHGNNRAPVYIDVVSAV
jgi:hypothetical protein